MALKQYVNLDPNIPDQLNGLDKLRAGRNVSFTAKLNKGIAGVPIMFEVTLGAKNISTSLEAANFTPKEMRAISQTAAGGVGLPGSLKRRILTDKKGESTIKLVLSECGGDEFTVKAYIPAKKGKGKELGSETFVVWRRLYYQISRFKSGPKGAGRTGTLPEIPKLDWGPVISEYTARDHNIELVDDSGTDLVTRRANILDAEADLKKSAREGYNAKREPVTIRAVLVNQIASPGDEELIFPAVSEDEPIEQGTSSPLWKDESMPLKKDFIIEAKWRFVGEPRSAERNIDLAFIEAKGRSTVRINFKDLPKRHFLDFWRTATVRLKVRVLTGSTNGLSWYNTVWMAHENMHRGARGAPAMQQTTIHEVGHYIGMAAASQSTHYVGHSHQGPHCATGVSVTDLTKASYSGLSGSCIMFGESSATRQAIFCPICDPFVRSRGIPAKRMPASW
ncbi:MAG: hypothetical protein ABIW76_03760 [Fibrobacteria bacterium]